ncbi:MAG: arginine--tRNA ligase [Alkalispirochaeta sp.]
MKQYWTPWKTRVLDALLTIAGDGTDPSDLDATLLIETPPDTTKGDIAFPMFPFARVLRRNPAQIAAEVATSLNDASDGTDTTGTAEAIGPYVNIFLPRAVIAAEVINTALSQGTSYGDGEVLQGQRIMIEFSCPNTNKPLHLGHLRNDALGESVARVLTAAGADVRKVNLINDRGIHICKSMLAYRRFGNGTDPESENKKSDRFVGDFYVKYAQWEKEDPQAEPQAREMLKAWEDGDPEIHELWLRMNRWAIEGIEETYRRTGIRFDQTYFESQTYSLGRDEILKGLADGVFYRDEKGTVWVDLTDINLDKKVLLRGDGTSLYLTQDIGTAIRRHEDWPFHRLIYVVASEQRYHFQVLFEVLRRLGKEWAGTLYHLAYGMVNLPDGKMKSREGTVVDADDLLDRLTHLAAEEIRGKGREEHVEDVDATAEKVALAALHYYLLQTGPVKDMVFDPEESLSFSGNTGPYLQYLGARVSSMLRRQAAPESVSARGPDTDDEWQLVHRLAGYPDAVADSAQAHNPAMLAGYLYDTAKTFSRFYHDHPIAVSDDPAQREYRLGLSRAVMNMMHHGLTLLNIPFVEAM